MHRFLAVLFLAALSFNSFALTGVTKDGYIACQTEEWLDDIMAFVRANDTASGDAYLKSKKCLILRAGVKVTILNTTWSGRIQFAKEGFKMWTVREAIDMD